METGKANRYRVVYIGGGEAGAFCVHTVDDAKWWAMFMRNERGCATFIDRENAPAHQRGQ